MKKQYLSPATEVVATGLVYSTCAATGGVDPNSIKKEATEDLAKSRGNGRDDDWGDLW